jgi:hypothetical protein
MGCGHFSRVEGEFNFNFVMFVYERVSSTSIGELY